MKKRYCDYPMALALKYKLCFFIKAAVLAEVDAQEIVEEGPMLYTFQQLANLIDGKLDHICRRLEQEESVSCIYLVADFPIYFFLSFSGRLKLSRIQNSKNLLIDS